MYFSSMDWSLSWIVIEFPPLWTRIGNIHLPLTKQVENETLAHTWCATDCVMEDYIVWYRVINIVVKYWWSFVSGNPAVSSGYYQFSCKTSLSCSDQYAMVLIYSKIKSLDKDMIINLYFIKLFSLPSIVFFPSI